MNEDINCLACMVPPNTHAKRLLLVDLITTYSQAGKTIVFCNTKRECETVVSGVSAIMPAEALHGDIQQDMREFTMARFREVCPCRSLLPRFRSVLLTGELGLRALSGCIHGTATRWSAVCRARHTCWWRQTSRRAAST